MRTQAIHLPRTPAPSLRWRRRVPGAALAVTAGLMLTSLTPQASAAGALTNGLVKARNATSITYDPSSNAVFDPGLSGFSYSAVALVAAGATAGGTVRVSDIDYQWPNTTSGQFDSVALRGQTIPVTAPAGATEVGMLGASYGAPATVPMVFNYVSCKPGSKKVVKTTGTGSVTIPDWWAPASMIATGGVPPNAKMAPFLMAANAVPVAMPNLFFEVKAPLDKTRRLVSITFPTATSVLFDLQVRQPASPPRQVKGCP